MSEAAVADKARSALAATVRRLHLHEGSSRRHLARINRMLLRRGASPQVAVSMRVGHRMQLDLRSGTEWPSYYTGRFDDERIRAACDFLRPGTLALDAGANIGFWTIPLAQRAKDVGARVIAVEPIPANVERLRANLAVNGLVELAEIWQLAVSDRRGVATMTLREDFTQGASTGNASVLIPDRTDRRFHTLTTPVASLDEKLSEAGERPVSVIKADLEGHEDRFLAGAYRTFERYRPVAFLEWNEVYYTRRRIDPTAAVRPILSSLGYVCLRREGRSWHPVPDFNSDRPVDDLVMAPGGRAERIASVLEGSSDSGGRVRGVRWRGRRGSGDHRVR